MVRLPDGQKSFKIDLAM